MLRLQRNQQCVASPNGNLPTVTGRSPTSNSSVRLATHTVRIDTQLVSEPSTVPLVWLPDTGSDVDAVGARHLEQLGGFLENLQPDYNDVRTADGTSLKSFGSIPVTLASDGRQHVSTLHVYDGLDDALLSRQFLVKPWVSYPRTGPSTFFLSSR